MAMESRFHFAIRRCFLHLLASVVVAVIIAAFVYFFLYPTPYQYVLSISSIFFVLLAVDVVCGPLMTLLISNPKKSKKETILDFSLVGILQIAALIYGLHFIWLGRPVVLAFEIDRIAVITANEIEKDKLHESNIGIQSIPWYGVIKVNTRRAKNSDEMFESIEMEAAGISPGGRPGWWLPWDSAKSAMSERAKPVADLLQRRPQDADVLQTAIKKAGFDIAQLRYLPLTSSKTTEWIVLLDTQLNIVGYAPVDGF